MVLLRTAIALVATFLNNRVPLPLHQTEKVNSILFDLGILI
jgi:hypothetical protein